MPYGGSVPSLPAHAWGAKFVRQTYMGTLAMQTGLIVLASSVTLRVWA